MPKKTPLRQCVGCREMKEKTSLVRIIKTPDNQILFDKSGKMNGRGAYICLDSNCFDKAVKNKGIERTLKCEIPVDVFENVKKEICKELI